MPLKTFVKASSISNLSDARYFAAYPVNWMSFECNPEKKEYVHYSKVIEMIGWLSGPQFCLEVAELAPEAISSLLELVKVDGLQVSLHQKVESQHQSKTIFREFVIDADTTIQTIQSQLAVYQNKTNFFILNFDKEQISFSDIGTSTQFTKNELQEVLEDFSCLLTLSFEPNELDEILALNTKGLNIPGGEEEKVGLRSFDDLQDIMEELEVWE